MSTFLSKGPPTSLISGASYFNLGIDAFSGGLSGDETEFWVPCDTVSPQLGVWSAADTPLQEPIAVVGDIKSCFYQVFVDENDRDAFRFLWFPNKGATSS